MFSAASVCLSVCLFVVCQHDNFRTSKHRMMKLGGRCIVQKYRPSSNLGVIAPSVHTSQKCGVGLQHWGKSAHAADDDDDEIAYFTGC